MGSGDTLQHMAFFGRALTVWLAIIVAETIHGTVRTLAIEPMLGGVTARQISVFTGSLIIFALTMLLIKWMNPRTVLQAILIGALWVALTLGFELLLGRYVIGLSWDRLIADYDPSRGGLMLVGILFLFAVPLLSARLRGVL